MTTQDMRDDLVRLERTHALIDREALDARVYAAEHPDDETAYLRAYETQYELDRAVDRVLEALLAHQEALESLEGLDPVAADNLRSISQFAQMLQMQTQHADASLRILNERRGFARARAAIRALPETPTPVGRPLPRARSPRSVRVSSCRGKSFAGESPPRLDDPRPRPLRLAPASASWADGIFGVCRCGAPRFDGDRRLLEQEWTKDGTQFFCVKCGAVLLPLWRRSELNKEEHEWRPRWITSEGEWWSRQVRGADGQSEETRACQGCGEIFTPSRRDQCYCGPTCRKRGQRKREKES